MDEMRLRNIPGAVKTIDDSPFCIKLNQQKLGECKQQFPTNQPLHIEIGMGKGQFIMELARLNPQINYIGIERYASVLLRALQKMEELSLPLPNLKFICADAALLPDYFQKGEIAKIYLNFSDPWPKDRHAKRRLTSHQFFSRYGEILDQNGTVEFKTDNRQLFDFSVEEVHTAGWKLNAITYDLHQDSSLNQGNIMTEYEEKFSSKGNPIHKLIASM